MRSQLGACGPGLASHESRAASPGSSHRPRAGPHRIRVPFCQGGGRHDLFVRWQRPGIEKCDIPAEALSHRPGGGE
jgi:hypothetical protein